MKILHIIDRFNPNLGQEINFIVKNKADDYKMSILTSTSLKPWKIKFGPEISIVDEALSKKHDIQIVRQKLLFEYGEKLWLRKLIFSIEEIKPDILFIHGIEYLTFFRIILWHKYRGIKFIKIVTDTHSLPIFTRGTFFRSIYYFFLSKCIIPIVNSNNIPVFFTAEENRKMLINIYGVNEKLAKPFIIGADLKTFVFNNEERKRIRNSYGIGPNDILLIYTGRLCREKGPHLIIESLNRIHNRIEKNLVVLFIGFRDEEYMDTYFKRRINFSFRIFIEPPKASAALSGYYSASDLAVFPLESTLSSMECQACRLPVLMEANFTNDQRIKEGGLSYRKGDIEDLSEKLLILINDNHMRAKLSDAGYSYINRNYNYLKNLEKMEGVLRNYHINEN